MHVMVDKESKRKELEELISELGNLRGDYESKLKNLRKDYGSKLADKSNIKNHERYSEDSEKLREEYITKRINLIKEINRLKSRTG